MKQKNIIENLCAITGKDSVLTSQEDRLSYSYDASHCESFLPLAVVLPRSTNEIRDIVKLAGNAGICVIPRGSGTGLSGGTIPSANSIVVSLTRMNKLVEIDTKNLTATVEPGMITDNFTSAVERKGLFYPPDPSSYTVSTIGGNVAENAGGLRGLKYGVTSNYILGLEAVLANGEVIDTRFKCIKNVAGYNLTSVLAGSEGTLAIVTQILFKLLPLPAGKKTMLATFSTFADAASCIEQILGVAHIIPATMEFLDKVTMKCVNQYLGNVLPSDANSILLIEVDGPICSIEEDAPKIVAICKDCNALTVQLAANQEEALLLAKARRSALPALSRIKPTTILEDVSVPPSMLATMLEEITAIRNRYNVEIGVFGHAGDGNLHPTFLANKNDGDEMARVQKAVNDIFNKAIEIGGVISGEHGIGISKMPFLPLQYKKPTIDIMKQIKQALDPAGILNPGKMF